MNNGYPTRFRRFCCSQLKEYKILDKVIMGIRADESTRRKERYKEPTECRVYNKKERVEAIYPILDYTLKDVAEFVNYYNLKLAPIYYRDDGSIDFTRRLGCIGCPLKSDCGRSDFKRYPKFLIAWLKAGHQYMQKRKAAGTWNNFAQDAYQLLAAHLFYQDKMSDFRAFQSNPLFPQDWKGLLEDYFQIELPELTETQ